MASQPTFELLPCQFTKKCKNCRKDIKHINISFYFLQKIPKMLYKYCQFPPK